MVHDDGSGALRADIDGLRGRRAREKFRLVRTLAEERDPGEEGRRENGRQACAGGLFLPRRRELQRRLYRKGKYAFAEATGADTFEIKPAKPYPKEYTPATELAKKEKNENARPEIVGSLPDVSKYDVIFLGYPIWWGDLPMPCYTFFDKVKLEGKTVAPFCTHEGSGLSGTDRYIADTTKAKVTEALVMTGTTAQKSRDEAKKEVSAWLKKVGYGK